MILAVVLVLLAACGPARRQYVGARVPVGAATLAPYGLGGAVASSVPPAPPAHLRSLPIPLTSSRVGVSLPLSKLDSFITVTGTRPGELSIYQNWASGELFDQHAGLSAQQHGMGITVTWEPWSAALPQTAIQPAYTDRTIAAGAHDAYIKAYAHSVLSYGQTVTIRLAHEMNGQWYPWGVGVNNNTAADYVAMWQHVVTLFRLAGVRNVLWEWSPNLKFIGDTPMADAYPGDAFVNKVALSGYNWGVGQYSVWQSFSSLYGPSIDEIRNIAPTKPFYVSEIACATVGGDKAAWIADLFTQLRTRPYIKELTWFDQTVAIRDWLIEDSPAATAAWKAGVKSLG